jgi:Zn-dependent protease
MLIFILAFLVTITIHEAAHAYVANRLGDPTARLLKRLTLNPLAHIDIYGTVIVPFFLILVGSPFVFGWAKPVPIDPYNLANPKKDSALISFAGPLANIALATVLAILLRFVLIPVPAYNFMVGITEILIRFNVVLAVFNLVPIHPLDGGKVLVGLLPERQSRELDNFLNRFGMFILIFLIFPIFGGTSLIISIISPIIELILKLLLPGSSVI